MKDITPTFKKLPTAEMELNREYSAGSLPFGENIGGLQAFASVFKRGFGDKIFGVDDRGWWMGAADYDNAPLKSDYDGNFLANSATIGNAVHIYKQTSIPTSVSVGDLWFDTDDSNKLYRSASVGADQITTGEWEAVDDQRAADALLANANKTLNAVISVGGGNIIIDGANRRILIYDASNNPVGLIGYGAGLF